MAAKPILLTGAAGALGRYLRPKLIEAYGRLRSADKVSFAPALNGEEQVVCDLHDLAAVERMVEGTEAILHFGAYSVEADWETILHSNIIGTYNVFEAARRKGIKRLVFASSNHAIGFHTVETRLDATSLQKPDSYYGVSKAFGEDLGSLYVDKHNLEVACLRIGSCLPEPKEARHLSTWLSYPDLLRLIQACLEAPFLGFTIMYGMSNNTRSWWDNSLSPHVAYRPEDNAETYAKQILSHGDPRPEGDPARRFHGGPFTSDGYVRR
ncbi:MAG: NAD(P)-dependent oxidoreductase [Proteobacteria bacterium]|nr:NAD(P)-dependent oxidoreductase [Pseudomonadota bacterium]MBI3499468.1 NAD(P)-dependent oxidoreductase [Pseudomonadota bacterium]